MSASCYSLIKALVLNAIFVSLCIPTNAQTQRYTMSEKFNKGIEVSNTITLYIPGTLKYSYKHSLKMAVTLSVPISRKTNLMAHIQPNSHIHWYTSFMIVGEMKHSEAPT